MKQNFGAWGGRVCNNTVQESDLFQRKGGGGVGRRLGLSVPREPQDPKPERDRKVRAFSSTGKPQLREGPFTISKSISLFINQNHLFPRQSPAQDVKPCIQGSMLNTMA